MKKFACISFSLCFAMIIALVAVMASAQDKKPSPWDGPDFDDDPEPVKTAPPAKTAKPPPKKGGGRVYTPPTSDDDKKSSDDCDWGRKKDGSCKSAKEGLEEHDAEVRAQAEKMYLYLFWLGMPLLAAILLFVYFKQRKKEEKAREDWEAAQKVRDEEQDELLKEFARAIKRLNARVENLERAANVSPPAAP